MSLKKSKSDHINLSTCVQAMAVILINLKIEFEIEMLLYGYRH